MPLECSVTLQQMFPILSGTFANHGKMFLNNKKVDSTVAMTAYTLEILPDECSSIIFITGSRREDWIMLETWFLQLRRFSRLMSDDEYERNGSCWNDACSFHFNASYKLRGQRCGLIENAEQYGTVYRAIALWFKNKSTDEEIQKKVNEFAPCVQ
ncbi:hypothetical protein L5515_003982 [Caenorhabditis briggsae]|uniref:Uncharacterized protein n=1 Tax=Caenorhabditis briggsae TaxID=6238 RepID=A0AAE9JCQ6_CAEBR|nr:hypothetical protein L5515_003982 [Caenorhabditis briggsae]